uniref:Protein Red n=3 Tax=Meloidogyne TaxID=189290 RepID=A0A915M7H5_MELJA
MSEAKLKNEDFRKLLASSSSTRVVDNNSTTKTTTASHAFTHRKIGNSVQTKAKPKKYIPRPDHVPKPDDDIFDESEARLVEILKNYRDRASERRKGMFSDETEISKLIRASKDVENVGSVLDASAGESRKMQIQKSKYLGGDMEHTHLVKGLDYSLLNKVRTEIHEQQVSAKEKALNDPVVVSNDPTQAGSKLARNVCKILFENKLPQRNELFVRGRMAYLVELDEEESDVPSTLMRSVVDSSADQTIENINADNVLINKLSQVLVYLRTDLKKKKKTGFERDLPQHQESTSIFEGLDDYEELLQKKRRKLEQEDAYAEFYPGGLGMMDAGGESDDDDFSQMDQGNRKSQIKRWDFDTQEDYERYQSAREAHPRAVYQFGSDILLTILIAMKLLLHNLLSSKFLKGVNTGFPLILRVTKSEKIELGENDAEQFVKQMMPRLDYNAFRDAAQIVDQEQAVDLPSNLPDDWESNTGFLKKMYSLLVGVEIVEGEMECPETHRIFPISEGIPNMLARADEIEEE